MSPKWRIVILMNCAQIFVTAMVAIAWTRMVAAQPPVAQLAGAFSMVENPATQTPGMGRDWRRFGSGLEDSPTTQLPGIGKDWRRFGSGLEDDYPIATSVRFGSGLEDDARVQPLSVFHQPGF